MWGLYILQNLLFFKVKIYFDNYMIFGFGIIFLIIYFILVRLVEMINDIYVVIIKRK